MPRAATTLASLLLLTVAVATSACKKVNVQHRDALRDAEAARQRGDAVGAAWAYRTACEAKPNDKKSCEAADWYTDMAIDQRLAAARPLCEPAEGQRVDARGCLRELAPARKLAPEHTEILRLVDAAGRAHLAACLARTPDEPAEAVLLWRCVASLRAEVATQRYEQGAVAASARAAGVFVDLAARDGARGHAGAQTALWSAAACLDADAEIGRRAALARRDFLSSAAVPLDVTLAGGLAGDPALAALCARTAEALGERAVCRAGAAGAAAAGAAPGAVAAPAAAAGPAPLALRVDISVAPVDHTVSESRRTISWQEGVRRTENPRYRTAETRLLDAERALREVEPRTRELAATCSAAEDALSRAGACSPCAELDAKEKACREADAVRGVLDTREREAREARDELGRTVPILEEPIMREGTITVRAHAWRVRWTASLELAGARTQASGEIDRADEEHPGLAAAGVGSDPLSAPTGTWYLPGVAAAVAQRAAAVASGELTRRATERRAACVGDAPVWTPAWLDCWAESTLWSGTVPAGLELLTGSAHAADRAGSASGLPMPACARAK